MICTEEASFNQSCSDKTRHWVNGAGKAREFGVVHSTFSNEAFVLHTDSATKCLLNEQLKNRQYKGQCNRSKCEPSGLRPPGPCWDGCNSLVLNLQAGNCRI